MSISSNDTRVTNVDALSALIDRLIVENIKRYFFAKDGLKTEVNHQDEVIASIKKRMTELLTDCITESRYRFLAEHRTFPAVALIQEIEDLIYNNIDAGEAERAKLSEILSGKPELKKIIENELRSRRANEGRAKNKNNIDELLKTIVSTDLEDNSVSPASSDTP